MKHEFTFRRAVTTNKDDQWLFVSYRSREIGYIWKFAKHPRWYFSMNAYETVVNEISYKNKVKAATALLAHNMAYLL